MNRLPIRIRLTLAFALVMAIVLAATGLFLYVRLGRALDGTINQALRTRASDVAALVRQASPGLQNTRGSGSAFAQVIDENGRVVDSTPGLPRHPLVTGNQTGFTSATIGDEHVRLLTRTVQTDEGTRLVVVGASLEPRAEALADLERQLLMGGPIALLLASLAGYALAAAALRPVERMGERAATISAASPGRRLPVPPADDEIARLGRRLNEMLARLETTLDRERALVANASHELRTPLALLKTEIELALNEPDSAPALAAALRSVGEETDRLAQLADDLLLLARVDSGGLPLRRSPVDMEELLETVAVRFGRRAADAQRVIEVHAPAALVALVDRRRIEQALANLVENALRHGTGRILLEAAESGSGLVLRVSDEGAGFPPAFRSEAFERFSRAGGTSGGAGLGLAIVAAIATAHGGTASLGDGGVVELRLPVRQRSLVALDSSA